MKAVFYTVLLIGSISFANTTFDWETTPALLSQKCMTKAMKVIEKKGTYRNEKTEVISISSKSTEAGYEQYYVGARVTPRNSAPFKQVCGIILKSSNCSYDQTYACAASVEELESLFN